MCDYWNGTTWECREGGYLWDADNDGYDPDDDCYPCPKCNTEEYLADAKEFAESTVNGSNNAYFYTGESTWIESVKIAEKWNPEGTKAALAKIGTVEALRPDNNPNGYAMVRFVYGE